LRLKLVDLHRQVGFIHSALRRRLRGGAAEQVIEKIGRAALLLRRRGSCQNQNACSDTRRLRRTRKDKHR
jgi:hypothetical protein